MGSLGPRGPALPSQSTLPNRASSVDSDSRCQMWIVAGHFFVCLAKPAPLTVNVASGGQSASIEAVVVKFGTRHGTLLNFVSWAIIGQPGQTSAFYSRTGMW